MGIHGFGKDVAGFLGDIGAMGEHAWRCIRGGCVAEDVACHGGGSAGRCCVEDGSGTVAGLSGRGAKVGRSFGRVLGRGGGSAGGHGAGGGSGGGGAGCPLMS